MKLARGYIASGPINGSRAPQHIQNQIIRDYCDRKGLRYILSRAEYWFDENASSQLWAAVKEEYQVIVFYSLWQLPKGREERSNIIKAALVLGKELYFACENESIRDEDEYQTIEEIFLAQSTIDAIDKCKNNDFKIQ